MPRVPLAENEQTLAPISRERFDAPDTGAAGRAIGGAVVRLGGQVGQVAEAQDTIETIYAEARAKKRDNEYQERQRDILFNPETGYYNSRNEDALDNLQPVQEQLRTLRNEVMSNAKDGRERAMLEEVLTRREQAAFDGMTRHAQTEIKNFRVTEADAGMANAADSIARFTGLDDAETTRQWSALRSEFQRKADLMGWNRPDVLQSEWIKVQTDAHETVVQTMTLADPRKAEQYLAEHRDDMDPRTVLNLENTLMPMVAQDIGREYASRAAEFVAGTVTMDAPTVDAASGDTPQAGSTGSTQVVAVSRTARPSDSAPRMRATFPNSYRDPLYDRLDRQYEAKYGLPPGLLSSIRLDGEKSNANQVSSAGARGPYQFIATTRSGFVANYGIDPYRSPDEQVEAAAIHLRDDIVKYGSVARAVAAYNGGHRGATNPVRETVNYVARVTRGMAARGTPIGDGTVALLPGGVSPEVAAERDLATQIEWAETAIPEELAAQGRPPRFIQMAVDAAKATIRADHADKTQMIRVEQEAAWNQAQETVLALGDRLTNPATQVPGWNTLPVERRLQLQNVAEANIKARETEQAPETDWTSYARYSDMTPQQLRRVPLDELRRNLGDTEFKEIVRERGGEAKTPKQVTANGIVKIANRSLIAAGLTASVGTASQRTERAQKINQFTMAMMRWADTFRSQNTREPNDEEIRRQADRFLIEGTDATGEEMFAFESPTGALRNMEIPDNVRAAIKRAFPNATEDEIKRHYVAGRGIDW